MLIALRNIIPDTFSIVLANGVGVYSMIALIRGLHRFYGLRWPVAWESLTVIIMLLVVVFTYWHPSYPMRVLLFGLCLIALAGRGLCFWPTVRARSGAPLAGWLTLMFGLTLLTYGMHVSAVCLLAIDYNRLAGNVVSEWMFSLLYPLSSFGLYLGLIAAHAHRQEQELQKALQEVKTIRGIIPVCCSCKKIMNHEGSWDQMEIYISQHTEAQFSHGFCPDCARRALADFEQSSDPKR